MRAWPNTGITMLRVFIRVKILHLTFVVFCSTIHSTTFCWESSLSPSGITLSLLIYSTLIDTVCPGEQRELVIKYFSFKRLGTFVELMTVRSEWKRHMKGSVVFKRDLVYVMVVILLPDSLALRNDFITLPQNCEKSQSVSFILSRNHTSATFVSCQGSSITEQRLYAQFRLKL